MYDIQTNFNFGYGIWNWVHTGELCLHEGVMARNLDGAFAC